MEIPKYVRQTYRRLGNQPGTLFQEAAEALQDMTAIAMEAEHKHKDSWHVAGNKCSRCIREFDYWRATAHKALMEE